MLSIAFLSGCAGGPEARSGYEYSNLNDTYLKDIDDKKALALFNKVYNEPVVSNEDRVAKDITITAFMKALTSLNSPMVNASGVLGLPHKNIDLKTWTDDALVSAYNALISEQKRKKVKENRPKFENESSVTVANGKRTYWKASSDNISETKEGGSSEEAEETITIIRLTAIYSIGGELGRRDSEYARKEAIGMAVGGGLALAKEVAVILAGFLI